MSASASTRKAMASRRAGTTSASQATTPGASTQHATQHATQHQDGALPRVRLSAERFDTKEVEKLDSWFEGVSQPSQRIRDLVRRKRKKHDALVRQLRQELFRERSAAEGSVCFISTNLRAELDKAHLMVKLKGEELAELPHKDERMDAHAFKEAVSTARDVVQQLTEQRKRAVDAFYDLLLDVEAEHQARAKAALRRYGNALTANGHLPPHRLQPVLDAERKEVGEVHLRHVISFGDLRLCLNAHADRDSRKFEEVVENTRRVSREKAQRAAVSVIQEAGDKSIDESIASTLIGRESVKDFERKLSELKDAVSWAELYPYPADTVISWEIYVRSHLRQIDVTAPKMLKGLTEALNHLKIFCTNEVERLKEYLMACDLSTIENFHAFYKNICKPLIANIDKKISEEHISFTMQVKQILTELFSQFESFVCLLKDAGELWDQWCKLQKCLRQRTLQSLHEKIPDRRNCVEAKERRIAQIIERSNQETNKKNLEENVKRIFKILNDVKCSYETMLKTEKEMIGEHISSTCAELNSFNFFIKRFLKTHEGSKMKVDVMNVIKNSSKILLLIEGITIYIGQEEARCYQDIETKFFEGKFEDAVQLEETQWMQEEILRVEKEYSQIFESHRLRYDEIKSQVEIAQLARINQHEVLFKSQREANSKVCESFHEALEETYKKELEIFREFSSTLRLAKEDGLHSMLVESVRDKIHEVDAKYALCKESISSLNCQFETEIQGMIQRLTDENHHFLESLRYFSEGGSYTESEVTSMKAEVETMELDAKAQGKKIVLLLNQKSRECCSEAIKHVRLCSNDLQMHLEDLTFMNNITSIIQKTQSQLKQHVLALKYGGKLLVEQTRDVEQGPEQESMPEITKKWRCVTKTVVRRRDWLLSKLTLEDADDEAVKSASELVEYKPDNAFLKNVFTLLRKSLREIELIAKGFYEKKFCPSQNGQSNPSNGELKTFLSDIASRFKLYQEQCIEVWMSELTVLLKMILKLRNKFGTYCKTVISRLKETLSQSLEEERSKLNSDLILLRKNYQQHQVDSMVKLSTNQTFPESQHIFSSLCAEFEETTGALSQNIKAMVEFYMETARKYFEEYKDNLLSQRAIILATMEVLFGHDLEESFIERIERDLIHLSEFCSFQVSMNMLPPIRNRIPVNHPVEKQHLCPSGVQKSLKFLMTTADTLRSSYMQDNINSKSQKPHALEEVIENNVKEAKELVHNGICEVKDLYDQYNNMAEDLRIKWKSTLDNIRQD